MRLQDIGHELAEAHQESTGAVVERESCVSPLSQGPKREGLDGLGPVTLVAVQHLG